MNFLMDHFTMFRGGLYLLLESTPEKIADEIPEGFNNNIRWHGGHILTVADAFFGLKSVPGEYQALFGPGSKPENGPGEVPSLETLLSQLREQESQVKEKIVPKLHEVLPTPIQIREMEIKTFGEVAAFNNAHEAMHLSSIQAFKRMIEKK